MSQEERALYDAKALRKAEGRQRWLEEYRTLDKKTKKDRRLAKKKAKSERKAYRANYKIHKNVWKNLQVDDDRHTRQLKKAEILRFKNLHWGLIDMINGMQLIEEEEKLTEGKNLQLQEEL